MSRRKVRVEHYHGLHRQFRQLPERGWAWERRQELERCRRENRQFVRWLLGFGLFIGIIYLLVKLAS